FRASARTQLAARTAGLGGAELDAVQQLAEGRHPAGLDAMSTGERVRVIDAALDLVDVRHGRDIVTGADPAADVLRQGLLESRSAIGVASPPLVIPTPSAGGGGRGHGWMRFGLGQGASARGVTGL